MQIPDSIEKLTTTKPSSEVFFSSKKEEIPFDEIILTIKKCLDTKALSSFEKGLVFMKNDISTDKQIIKNYISLVTDAISGAIKIAPNISEDCRNDIMFAVKTNLEALRSNFESLYNILYCLNKQKNLLDSNEISFIILGYAISIIKKIHNS